MGIVEREKEGEELSRGKGALFLANHDTWGWIGVYKNNIEQIQWQGECFLGDLMSFITIEERGG